MKEPGALRQIDVVEFIATQLDDDLHARRVLSPELEVERGLIASARAPWLR